MALPTFAELLRPKKLKKGGFTTPSYMRKTATGSATTIADTTPDITNTDLTLNRNLSTQRDVVRGLSISSPDLSQATSTVIRFAITDSYTVVAHTLDGRIDSAATELVQTLVTRFDKLPSTYSGFTKQMDMRSTSESLLQQLLWFGSMSGELVLGKGAIPEQIRPVSVKDMKFENRNGKVIPYIVKDGVTTYLDSPLVFYAALDQDLDEAYSTSPLISAVQPVLFNEEFKNDLRRAFRRVMLPRVRAKINTEEFKASLPQEIQFDEKKLSKYMSDMINDIESQLNELEPEDALVYFDLLDIENSSAGNISAHENVNALKSLIESQLASGAKTLPVVLGNGETSSVASTESMLYLKFVESLQEKLNVMYSQMFTLASRLFGHDVTVTFKYRDPEMRPESELESFKAMKQSRILEQLSLGFLTDEEASILLNGTLPPSGMEELSGTRFHGTNAANIENPYSNTSVTGKGVTETKGQQDSNSNAPRGVKSQ